MARVHFIRGFCPDCDRRGPVGVDVAALVRVLVAPARVEHLSAGSGYPKVSEQIVGQSKL
jgi:hypothetical protein